jgi:hypothetical protein
MNCRKLRRQQTARWVVLFPTGTKFWLWITVSTAENCFQTIFQWVWERSLWSNSVCLNHVQWSSGAYWERNHMLCSSDDENQDYCPSWHRFLLSHK